MARFLEGDDERADAAALALGESRLEAAVPILTRFCDDALAETRARVGYLALALLRQDAATGYLVERIRGAERADALAAARAVATFRDDAALAARARAAAAKNPDRGVAAEVEALFTADPRT